jgi:molybdenum cofactor guanylyltransferase
MKLRGLVLAGGKSSRFGSDKAMAFYQDRRLVEYAVCVLEEAGLRPVVSARRGSNYHFLGCPVISDRFPGLGPLGGLFSAFAVFKDTAFLTVTCDMPFLTAQTIRALLSERDKASVGTFFTLGGENQPFPGIYEPSAFTGVKLHIMEGRLSMRGLIDAGGYRAAAWKGEPSVFLNVNRTSDMPVPPTV